MSDSLITKHWCSDFRVYVIMWMAWYCNAQIIRLTVERPLVQLPDILFSVMTLDNLFTHLYLCHQWCNLVVMLGQPFFYMAFACCVNVYGECAHEQHIRRTLTYHTIAAYLVSGNVVRARILICATRQKPCRKRVYHDTVILRRQMLAWWKE